MTISINLHWPTVLENEMTTCAKSDEKSSLISGLGLQKSGQMGLFEDESCILELLTMDWSTYERVIPG